MWSAGGNKTVDGRGGFLDETYAGQQTQANKVEPTRGNSLVPLMIGHILQGSLETLTLWGTPIKLVCLVAYIRKVESVTTKVSYDIVDETGKYNYNVLSNSRNFLFCSKTLSIHDKTYVRKIDVTF